MTDDRFALHRFTTAQAPVIDGVLQELRAGQKRMHWMWFGFPHCVRSAIPKSRSSTGSARLLKLTHILHIRYLDRSSGRYSRPVHFQQLFGIKQIR